MSPRSPRTSYARNTFRLEPPRLRMVENPGEERHATWFELWRAQIPDRCIPAPRSTSKTV